MLYRQAVMIMHMLLLGTLAAPSCATNKLGHIGVGWGVGDQKLFVQALIPPA